jgi:glycine/D-amino acid oxidase-like deaminating enzyme
MRTDVVVVGAGFVGLYSAYRLKRAGYEVALVAGGSLRRGASWGNAGIIHQGSTTTVPEIMGFWRVVRLALRRGSYLSTSPVTALKESLPGGWIWRYAKSLRRELIAQRGRILSGLVTESKDLWLETIRAEGLETELVEAGSLEAYFSEELFLHESSVISAEAPSLGYRVEVIDGERCMEMEPLLERGVVGGLYYPDDLWVNPAKTLESLYQAVQRTGVRMVPEDADNLRDEGGRVRVRTRSEELEAEQAVVASGAWAGRMLSWARVRIPLAAGRGYLAVTEPTASRISRPTFYADEKIVISQAAGGELRLTSYFELNDPDAPLDRSKIRSMLEKARKIFPPLRGLRTLDEWVGSRPCLPDGLPVIGRLSERSGIIVATGLCRLGLTLSTATGRLVEGIVSGREDPILRHFSPQRFG